MENDKKHQDKKNTGDAKGKASLDQNGEGAAPKYGQAGEQPNESGETVDKADKKNKK